MTKMDAKQSSMTPDEQKAYQARQKQRAIVMAGLLFFMVVLFYLITIVKIGASGS